MSSAQQITKVRAQKLLCEKDTILIDVRSPVSYRDGSIPGAINITIRTMSNLFKIPRTSTLIFFGTVDNDPDITVAVSYAAQLGFNKLFTLGSIQNWQ